MQHQMSQLQHFQASHRHVADVLQEATWLAGRMGDNPNPLSWDEVKRLAKSNKPYAWAFQMIIDHEESQSTADREIAAACLEARESVAH